MRTKQQLTDVFVNSRASHISADVDEINEAFGVSLGPSGSRVITPKPELLAALKLGQQDAGDPPPPDPPPLEPDPVEPEPTPAAPPQKRTAKKKTKEDNVERERED